MRVLLPAGEIPIGATVTKRTGEKPYILRDQITIFTEPKQVIKAGDQARFLVGDNGDVNVVAMVTELLWTVSEDELSDYLEGTPQ